jgi:hypothetical protein
MAHQTFDVLVCDLEPSSGQRERPITALRTVPTALPIVVLLNPENRQQYNRKPLETRLVLSKPVSRKALLAGVKLALQSQPGPCTQPF